METTNNYIRAQSNWMRFFDVVTLRADEIPGITNETMNEIGVGYIGEDGSPRRVKIEKSQDQALIGLRVLSSKKVGYRTRDIYKGDIGTVAQRTFDIAWDLNFQVDRVAYKMATALVAAGGPLGTFTITGEKASRVYLPHSGIVTDHLPTTNIIDNKAAAEFNVSSLSAILKYAAAWGNVFPDGPLIPTGEVLVPASQVFDIFTDLALANTSSGQPNETDLNRQVRENGWLSLRWGGVDWKFIPDVTIPVNYAYPVFNKKIGKFFLKPDMDEEFVNTDREKHWEERSQNTVVGCAVVTQQRMNFCRVQFAGS